MEIEKILAMKVSRQEDMLTMIISNQIDCGGDDGGMVSVKKFNELARDIIKWHEQEVLKQSKKTNESISKRH